MADQNQNLPNSNSEMLDQVALLAFVDDLLKSKNGPHLKEEELPVARQVLLDEVNEAINTHLVNLLSDRAQVELDKLLDSNPTDEQLNQFLVKHIPRLEVEIAAALLNFRAAYLYPLREQIAKAVQTISPIQQNMNQSVEKQLQNEAPSLAPAPVQKADLDISFPKAPTAPLTGDQIPPKKWN